MGPVPCFSDFPFPSPVCIALACDSIYTFSARVLLRSKTVEVLKNCMYLSGRCPELCTPPLSAAPPFFVTLRIYSLIHCLIYVSDVEGN